MFLLYVVMMFMTGLFVDTSNTNLRKKIDELKSHYRAANDTIKELEELIDEKDEEIEKLENTLENLRDALGIKHDLNINNNPLKRRRIDQDV